MSYKPYPQASPVPLRTLYEEMIAGNDPLVTEYMPGTPQMLALIASYLIGGPTIPPFTMPEYDQRVYQCFGEAIWGYGFKDQAGNPVEIGIVHIGGIGVEYPNERVDAFPDWMEEAPPPPPPWQRQPPGIDHYPVNVATDITIQTTYDTGGEPGHRTIEHVSVVKFARSRLYARPRVNVSMFPILLPLAAVCAAGALMVNGGRTPGRRRRPA